MKYILSVVALVFSSVSTFAQGIVPLTGNVLLVTEYTRNVSLGWSDKKTWSDYAPRELTWSRTAEGLEVFSGQTANVIVDTKTYLHYFSAAGNAQLSETISQSSSREGPKLDSGTAWKAERTFATPSVSYCSDTKTKFDSKFEVEPRETYALKIDGKDTTLEVTPVVERGWWNRCYSGKRFTRLLVSQDLGAVVSIEFVSYTGQGQAHESSYRFNVKEIKRP
jgi:hypothetical protein